MGPLALEPDNERRRYEFTGEGHLGEMLRGVIDPTSMASPRGIDPILRRDYIVEIVAA